MTRYPGGWVVKGNRLMREPRKARRATAIHEAGHAVVAEFIGAKVHRLWLNGDEQGTTEAHYRVRRGRVDPVERGIVALAGHEAEVRLAGRPRQLLPYRDYEAVCRLGCGADSINVLGQHARRLVRGHEKVIRRVARALMQRGSLTRRQFLAVYRQSPPPVGGGTD